MAPGFEDFMIPEQLLTELRKLKESGVGDAELWAVAFQAGEAKALREAFLDSVVDLKAEREARKSKFEAIEKQIQKGGFQ
jgi:hypothetical protein